MTLTQILQKIREAFYTKKEIDSMGGGTSLSDTISQKADKSDLNDYLPKSGGQMTGNVISRDCDGDFICLLGGTAWNTGASVAVYGKDSVEQPSAFVLDTHDGSFRSAMIGKPDGSLTWGGKPIDVIDSQGDGYIRYSNGIQICWGNFKELTTSDKAISFPRAFLSSNPSISVMGQNKSIIITLAGWTTSGFYVRGSDNTSSAASFLWQAIGMWK